MMPAVFTRTGVKAIVHRQPANDMETIQAMATAVSCPVGAIRTHQPEPLVKVAIEAFPADIAPESIPRVFHLGYHSPST
jgi:hypothetical protein